MTPGDADRLIKWAIEHQDEHEATQLSVGLKAILAELELIWECEAIEKEMSQ